MYVNIKTNGAEIKLFPLRIKTRSIIEYINAVFNFIKALKEVKSIFTNCPTNI